jgi:hypothetical protein
MIDSREQLLHSVDPFADIGVPTLSAASTELAATGREAVSRPKVFDEARRTLECLWVAASLDIMRKRRFSEQCWTKLTRRADLVVDDLVGDCLFFVVGEDAVVEPVCGKIPGSPLPIFGPARFPSGRGGN